MNIKVIGAGLVGSLLSIFLKKRGVEVQVFEKREDPRKESRSEGRSINLVLTERGLTALGRVGLREEMLELGMPLYGRMIHHKSSNKTYQPYGKTGQAIYSVSRKQLNEQLLTAAEKRGVKITFNSEIDLVENDDEFTFGADGFASVVRKQMVENDGIEEQIHTLNHGYKELAILPDKAKHWKMENNALHIWPREQFMLIALPNKDGSFTCTLFLQMEGEVSFSSLNTVEKFDQFILNEFPDAYPLLEKLEEDYYKNPVSRLAYMNCWPWVSKNKVLIGDAAHAIVPFYGQGMNAGFEDCNTLDELLETNSSVEEALQKYQTLRKPNADAISALSLQNFIEMRDKVADQKFQQGKKLTSTLAELFPDKWIPQYSQVTFTNTPYLEAKDKGDKQQALVERIISLSEYHEDWQNDEHLKASILKEIKDFLTHIY